MVQVTSLGEPFILLEGASNNVLATIHLILQGSTPEQGALG